MTGRRKLRASGGSLSRFVAYKPDPDSALVLAADHPAVVEGRTTFPSNVVGPWDSPRLLVSGKNNAKIGGEITKGPWKGFPVYTLTLEERRTCPRSCAVWRSCYGAGMHWPRRNDAFHPDFVAALAAEVVTVARQHPEGFAVRLHVLGDFYSVPYVLAWAQLLEMLPNLHVFGFTARRLDDPDPESRRIAAAVQALNGRWSRWAIRTSHPEPGRDRSVVVDGLLVAAGVIVCPAQTERTAACATCALCWSPSARDKTIGFLRHGIKISRGPRTGESPMAEDSYWSLYRIQVLTRLWTSKKCSSSQIAEYLGCTKNMVIGKVDRLDIEGGWGRAGRPPSLDRTLMDLGLPEVCAA